MEEQIYLDFIIDATVSMKTIMPAVYLYCNDFIKKYNKDIHLRSKKLFLGITILDGINTDIIEFNGQEFTHDLLEFRKGFQKIIVKNGTQNGSENLMDGILKSCEKMSSKSGIKGIILFSDSYGDFYLNQSISLQYVRLFLPDPSIWETVAFDAYWGMPLTNYKGRVEHKYMPVVEDLESIVAVKDAQGNYSLEKREEVLERMIEDIKNIFR